jgi:hypothetical protein
MATAIMPVASWGNAPTDGSVQLVYDDATLACSAVQYANNARYPAAVIINMGGPVHTFTLANGTPAGTVDITSLAITLQKSAPNAAGNVETTLPPGWSVGVRYPA